MIQLVKLVIPLPLMTLNQYTLANRGSAFTGAKGKKNATWICQVYVYQAMQAGFKLENKPSNLRFDWYASNKKTDKDNIAFQRKFIFDGFIKSKLLKNDGWKEIGDWEDRFFIDKENPRVEITEITMTD